ncbi:MAG: hypothetical protein KY466_02915 [Gemmatimonadetes bacterium]|nr:hypothetical protein [Gemmatimonadota bacterium]
MAMLPFQIDGPDAALADLRDWSQDLLVARLTGEGVPRALDPRAVSEALRGANDRVNGTPTVALSRRLGRALGADLLLYGEIAGTTDRLSLAATLAEAPSRAPQAKARVEGSADSLPHLVDRLTVRLLAARAARVGEDSTALASTSFPALRSYLAGRLAYRGGRIHDAEEYFGRALLLDSTFTPAALGIAAVQDNFWFWRSGDERWQADAIWKLRHRMSPAERALLEAYLGPNYPRASTLRESIAAAERAVLTARHSIEAWLTTAGYHSRYGQRIGSPDWQARSLDAARQAFAVDSTHAQTLYLLIMRAAEMEDTAAVRRFSKLHSVHNQNGTAADFVAWRAALALGDSAARAEVMGRYDRLSEVSLWRIMDAAQLIDGDALNDAERAADVLLARSEAPIGRSLALYRRARLLLNRGRPSEAARLLGEFTTGPSTWDRLDWLLEFRVYAGLYWDGDAGDAVIAVRQLEDYIERAPGNADEVDNRRTAMCALAHWRTASGDEEGARALLVSLGPIPEPTDFFRISDTTVCVATVEAMLAAGPRTAALARLESLLRDPWRDIIGVNSGLVLAVGNLVAARLHEERGGLPRALTAVRRASSSVVFLSTHRREEGRLAAAVGDDAAAIRAYRHYLDLRSQPEPRLRPEVERVRAELERLDRGRSGRSAPLQ